MYIRYFLALVILLILTAPIMMVSGFLTNYAIGTIVDAWSTEGGNLQLILMIFRAFGISDQISMLIGQAIVAELVLIGSIFGLFSITSSIYRYTKYLANVRVMIIGMIFSTIVSLGILGFESQLGVGFQLFALLNVFIITYFVTKSLDEN